jgi:hypothetical protein
MIADSNEMPLKINIPFKNFAYLYRQFHLSNCPELTQKLYDSMLHAFKYWTQAWETKDYVSNINIASLYNLLKADDRPKGDIDWKINAYNKYLIFNELSLLDELLFCLAQHLKKDKTIYDNYPNERKLLFFIAKDIKMFLFKKIRAVLSTQIRNNNFLIPINPTSKSYDTVLDIVYLNDRPLHMNVLLLIIQNKNYLEIIDILHISRKTYKDITTCLLQNLKPLNK